MLCLEVFLNPKVLSLGFKNHVLFGFQIVLFISHLCGGRIGNNQTTCMLQNYLILYSIHLILHSHCYMDVEDSNSSSPIEKEQNIFGKPGSMLYTHTQRRDAARH